MNPVISVVTPVYNRFDSLKYAVESVLAQTLPVLEIILIDDGSFDGTSELLPAYIAENRTWRERVRYFRQQNQGPGGARNTGIAQAKGEWLAFNDSDDIWLPQKLEWQFRALEKYKDQCELCFTDAWFANNPYLKTTLFQHEGNQDTAAMGVIFDSARLIVEANSVWCQTTLARADLIRRAGGFDPRLRWSEDRDFLFRAALLTKFCYVGMPMVLIDRSPTDLKHTGESENWRKEEFRLRMDQYRLEKQLSLSSELAPETRKSILKKLRCLHSQWANFHLRNGEWRKARQALSDAKGYNSDPMIVLKWALTGLTPRLARKVFAGRSQRETSRPDFTSWRTEEQPVRNSVRQDTKETETTCEVQVR